MVLFSTFSFTVEKHFCGGVLADYSIVGNLERCEMPSASHNDTEETLFDTVPCCQDIVETIDGSNDELSVAKQLDVQKAQFITAFFYSYLNLFECLEEHIVPFKNYVPPLVVKDISVLYDTFLI